MGYIENFVYLKALFKQDMIFHLNYFLSHILVFGRIQYLYLNWCFLTLKDLYRLIFTLKIKSKTADI